MRFVARAIAPLLRSGAGAPSGIAAAIAPSGIAAAIAPPVPRAPLAARSFASNHQSSGSGGGRPVREELLAAGEHRSLDEVLAVVESRGGEMGEAEVEAALRSWRAAPRGWRRGPGRSWPSGSAATQPSRPF
jgi:hypothetical protein